MGEEGESEPKTLFSRDSTLFCLLILLFVLFVLLVVGMVNFENSREKKEAPLVEDFMTRDGVFSHLNAFQKIAINSGDSNRETRSGGYFNSVEYVVSQLQKRTNYKVETQQMEVNFSSLRRIPRIRHVFPAPLSLVFGEDFTFIDMTGGGLIQSKVAIPKNETGCEESSFEGFPRGHIALVKRGICYFSTKTDLAIAAGASGVLIYNDGVTSSRYGLRSISISYPVQVPCLFLSYQAGQTIADLVGTGENDEGVVLAIEVMVEHKPIYSWNVFAETQTGSEESVVMVGSHLDGVGAGPGINDNGSGSASNLEMAIQFYRSGAVNSLKSKVRFAWWGAEELGLIGSRYYVTNLKQQNPEEFSRIVCYFNLDMLGSPNGIRFVGDGRNLPNELKEPSAIIQDIAEWWLDREGLSHGLSTFSESSDHAPFYNIGIPIGWINTGASGVKSMEERLEHGGMANAAYDPCYHQACDSVYNVDGVILNQLGRAASHVVQELGTKSDLRKFLNITK